MIKDIFLSSNKSFKKDFKRLMGMANPFYCNKNKNNYIEKLWYSNGQQIKISDMTTLHIENTVNYLLKNRSNVNDEWIKSFITELNSRK